MMRHLYILYLKELLYIFLTRTFSKIYFIFTFIHILTHPYLHISVEIKFLSRFSNTFLYFVFAFFLYVYIFFYVTYVSRAFLKLIPLLRQLSKTTSIIWVPQGVLQEKAVERGFTNANMILYNRVIQETLAALRDSPIIYWHSAWQSTVALHDSAPDGIHFGRHTKKHLLQMLINWFCRGTGRKQSSSIRDYKRWLVGVEDHELCCE